MSANFLQSLWERRGELTPPLTDNKDFYVTTYDTTPDIVLRDWALRIDGLVDKPSTITYADLQALPRVSRIVTLECIGNPVGGYSIGTAKWEGVPLNALLRRTGVQYRAIDLIMHAADGYSDSIPLVQAMEDDILLATHMNGVPLPPEHGFPARLIVPGLYGLKHVKWLTSLELVSYDYRGYWQQQNWPEEAPVKLSSRIDVPGDREIVNGKTVRISGIAFGGLEPIARMEVSTDEGVPWEVANLLPRLSPYSWTQWQFDWLAPANGEHTLVTRAIGASGRAQASRFGTPTPDGTIDLHAITVEVRNT